MVIQNPRKFNEDRLKTLHVILQKHKRTSALTTLPPWLTRNSPGDGIPECDTGSCAHLAFNTPTVGFPSDDLRTILHRCQRMAKVQNGEEILANVSTP